MSRPVLACWQQRRPGAGPGFSRPIFAPGMVAVMRRRFTAEGLGARAEVMDGQALGLEDESFDLGTSTFGPIFFPDPLAGQREANLKSW